MSQAPTHASSRHALPCQVQLHHLVLHTDAAIRRALSDHVHCGAGGKGGVHEPQAAVAAGHARQVPPAGLGLHGVRPGGPPHVQ